MNFSLNKPGKSRDILLIFLIVFGALLYRRFDAFTRPQLWAEDYAIYFLQYEQFGFKALFMPYGGYLHFVPRLVAMLWGSLHVDYLYIPVCYSISEFLITFFIAINIRKTCVYLDIKHKIVYATFFLFLPLGSDIYMNLTNVNWIVSLYLINFLFTRYTDHTNKNYYLNLAALLLASLSGPFSTLLIPLIVLVIIRERKELNFRKIVPLGVIIACGIIQLIYIKFIDPNFYRGVSGSPEDYHLFALFTNNMSQFLFLKYDFFPWLSQGATMLISSVVLLLFVYIFITRYVKMDNKRRYLLLCYAIIAFCAFIKAYWPNESRVLALDNPRYYFIPYLCIAWIMLLSFDRKITPLFIGLYLVFFIAQHRYLKMTLPDKHWKKQIQEYYDGKRQEIDINPEGWHFPAPPIKK